MSPPVDPVKAESTGSGGGERADEVRRVLVTGGSGFIGTNLVDRLLLLDAEVANLDTVAPLDDRHRPHWREGSVLDPDAVEGLFRSFRPHQVVHLAGRVDVEGETLDDYSVNTVGTANVLSAAAKTPSVQRTIVASTQFVCRPGYVPQHDEDFDPHTVYGQSKMEVERITRVSDLATTWTIVRPTTIWGPWDLTYRRQFYRVLDRGLYLHPADKPCLRSYGFVGNLIFELEVILAAPSELVDRKTFYVGDPMINVIDFVDGFSNEITGRPARLVPAGLIRWLGLVGDGLGRIGWRFPISSGRYRSMTEDYYVPLQPTLDLVGPLPYSLHDGVKLTVEWLRGIGFLHAR